MKHFAAILAIAAFAAQASATCTDAALWAAENAYGNDPVKTKISAVKAGEEYKVTVGIGNDEDGAHTYQVKFTGGTCDPKTASVCDLTQPSATPNCK